MRKPLIGFLIFNLLATFSFSREIDWTPSKRPEIRPPLQQAPCVSLLAPQELPEGGKNYVQDQSVGIVLSDNTVEDFERQLDRVLSEEGGRKRLVNGHIYVSGVPMAKKKRTRLDFERALKARNLHDVKVSIVTIPGTAFKGLSLQTAKAVLERIRYWFPSFEMDYQTPLAGEVGTGLISDAMVELPNVAYLYSVLSGVDFGMTAGIHTSLIVAYNFWNKAMTNWLLRPGLGKVGEFLKSATTTLPFVLNYSIFGNYSKIHNFYLEHGWEATQAQFPAELSHFVATQGLTTALQVIFYRTVIINGFGAWQNGQKGPENAKLARIMVPINKSPILVLDAIALFLASTNAYSLWNYGSFDLNGGHLALAGLTVAGKAAFWWKPNFLDPTLRWGKKLVQIAQRFKAFFTSSALEDE